MEIKGIEKFLDQRLDLTFESLSPWKLQLPLQITFALFSSVTKLFQCYHWKNSLHVVASHSQSNMSSGLIAMLFSSQFSLSGFFVCSLPTPPTAKKKKRYPQKLKIKEPSLRQKIMVTSLFCSFLGLQALFVPTQKRCFLIPYLLLILELVNNAVKTL